MDSPTEALNDISRECSVLSLEAQEQLAGTAPRVDTWLLLSYAGPMGAKALAESSIASRVKEYLNGQLEAIPNSRLLLIKTRDQYNEGKVNFYVVNGREIDPFYYSLMLDQYEDLLEMDIQELAAGNSRASGPPRREPFYLVCTNGKRDACCARYGLEVFEALRAQGAEPVWQCSHVSGHRYAANLIMFPHGIYYGRLTPQNAVDFLKAGRQGRLQLENYRGRAGYDPVVQAAEALLREQTERRSLKAYRFIETIQLEGSLWRVRFVSTSDEIIHELAIRRIETGDQLFSSCRGEKQSAVVRYSLEKYLVDNQDTAD